MAGFLNRLKSVFSCLFLLLIVTPLAAGGLDISPVLPALPEIEKLFPNASKISEPDGEFSVRTVYEGDSVTGYAFETNNVARIPAYSGEPVNVLVAMDPKGKILGSIVLEHHEPILLVGIPAQKLFDFAAQYIGLNAADRVKIGKARSEDGYVHLDAVSGATVTVMVVNVAIMRSASRVAQSLGILASEVSAAAAPAAMVKKDYFQEADWTTLTGNGSIRRLVLTNADIDKAFAGTEAEEAPSTEPEGLFAEIYFTEIDIPTVGRNLIGESEYNWLLNELKPGEHAIALMGNGYSFKGSGYVRGGIFDRILMHQGGNEFNFRDIDQHRINDIYIAGAPAFDEMSIFVVREHHDFDPGKEWQVELLIRRQTGPVDSVFTSFKADYLPIEEYITRPAPPLAAAPEVDVDLPMYAQVWEEREITVIILITSMVVLLFVIFLQDWLVQYPRFLHNFRRAFLVYTVLFIGWHAMGQLSVVNVFTFMQSLMGSFNWQTFLMDPVIFSLWVFVAFTVLLWGRGIYCGWLCPFGALQELLSEIAMKLKVPQFIVPWRVHERLWAVKYMILLALFGLSLDSLSRAETYAEVEPFKTVFLLHFDRDWPFIVYALFLIAVSIFSRKIYCRYICPLGAAIAIPSGVRLFDWLKRRKECGNPCQICAIECEISAITPTGEINLRECHHCLDCQVTYGDREKCPPLIKKFRKHDKSAPVADRLDAVEIG
jgi:NosR/NirI family nitrous oxide reductase transcriptional regulator